jgi:hypothetical protein
VAGVAVVRLEYVRRNSVAGVAVVRLEYVRRSLWLT